MVELPRLTSTPAMPTWVSPGQVESEVEVELRAGAARQGLGVADQARGQVDEELAQGSFGPFFGVLVHLEAERVFVGVRAGQGVGGAVFVDAAVT